MLGKKGRVARPCQEHLKEGWMAMPHTLASWVIGHGLSAAADLGS